MKNQRQSTYEIIKCHFKQRDLLIYNLLNKYPLEPLTTTHHSYFFEKLCRTIISQQLSGRAADTIISRFELLFNKEITPEKILVQDDQTIRGVGISWSKIKYLKDLSTHASKNSLTFEKLSEFENEKVIELLTQVKGIGRWTAEMFLIFTLGRENVFSWGDLGLKHGLEMHYHESAKTPSTKLLKIVENWSPYKSYASLVLWQSLDNR